MGAPQIIIICLYALTVGIHLANHGERRKDKYSFWLALVSVAISLSILYWGGFWS